ncbi:c-type cytochrome [Rhodanobacter sp. DHB23]|uniref:c-type cytochrome n=1 Tax=Rhodanobacter sp. DHB23 TaxID=2775923 RepID=UPI00177A9EF7|nr:c-type cytochrome [Rhodanobacter sp. DHB23]MBD8873143.1 c-type cytochrome [Rhodanobacter sp. DHB23]
MDTPLACPTRATSARRLRRVPVLVLSLLLSPAFAAGPAAASSPAAPSVPDTLQQRIAACVACHGTHGEGSPGSGFFPRLAGKPAGYLARQLADFQGGLRQYAPMEYTVRGLSPDYLREIAEYFAAQQVPYARSPLPPVPAQALRRGEQLVTQGDAARGVPACARCHGSQLTGVRPDIPGLVGLPYDYVSAQLGAWRTHTRATVAPDCMAEVAGRLSTSDITAVSAWLSSRELPADMHAQEAGSVQPPLHCGVLAGNGAGT